MGGSVPGQIDLNTVLQAGHNLSITREEKPEELAARLADVKADNAQKRWKDKFSFLVGVGSVTVVLGAAIVALFTTTDPAKYKMGGNGRDDNRRRHAWIR